MRRLAIIPARRGSRRLPRKNVVPLCGRPLFEYTVDAVVESRCFDEIIVSTDDEEVFMIADARNDVTVERRPDHLAGDTVKVIDLVNSIADRPGLAAEFEMIGLFLPTAPFRNAADIVGGLEMLTPQDYSVVSVCEMADPVQLSMTIDTVTGVANPEALLSPSPLVTGETRSQEFRAYYRVNGGFYIAWLRKFLSGRNFFRGQVKGYVMPRLRSVDIDYEHDLAYAEMLLDRGFVDSGDVATRINR